MSTIVEYLKDPYLVVRFQSFFGVHGVSESKSKQFSATISSTSGRPFSSQVNGIKDSLNQGDQDFMSGKDKISTRDEKVFNSTWQNEEGHRLRPRPVNGLNGGVPSEAPFEDIVSSESDAEVSPYIIKQKFWYYFFLFGTYLGDEVFYATFLPFWFWNIDGAVGRRIVMVWAIVMYLGQSILLKLQFTIS